MKWFTVFVLAGCMLPGCNGERSLEEALASITLTAPPDSAESKRALRRFRQEPDLLLHAAALVEQEELHFLFYFLYELAPEARGPKLLEAAKIASHRRDPRDATDLVAVISLLPDANAAEEELWRVARDPQLSAESRLAALHWLAQDPTPRQSEVAREAVLADAASPGDVVIVAEGVVAGNIASNDARRWLEHQQVQQADELEPHLRALEGIIDSVSDGG